MPRLFLIRHGEPTTAWGGQEADPGLSEAGKAQANAAAERLQAMGLLEVICSPMRRCQETAAAYAAKVAKPANIEIGVSEVIAPTGIGDRRAWLAENFPWRNPKALRTWDELDASVRNWREDVLKTVRAIKDDAAVFSHFIAINVIVGAAMKRPETIVFQPGYASITEIEAANGELSVRSLSHSFEVGEVR